MFHMHGTLDKYRQSSYLVNYKLINNVPYDLQFHISGSLSTYHFSAYNCVHCLSFFYTLMLMADTCGHVQFISMWASVWKFMHQALVEAGWQKTRQGESFPLLLNLLYL